MKIGYARVSRNDQNEALQVDALKSAGCSEVFIDRGVSGTKTVRDGLSKAMTACRENDTLVVWRLDRLGRSLSHLIDFMTDWRKSGRNFQSLNEGIDTSTANGELIFHIFASLAQFERRLIQERTKAGLEAAKRKGKRLGRPRKLTKAQIDHAKTQISGGNISIGEMAAILGVDRGTLRRAIAR